MQYLNFSLFQASASCDGSVVVWNIEEQVCPGFSVNIVSIIYFHMHSIGPVCRMLICFVHSVSGDQLATAAEDQ